MLNLFEKFEITEYFTSLLIAFVAILLDRLGDDAPELRWQSRI